MTPAIRSGRGPGSSAGRLLRAGWPGTRVTKTAVATGVAWWVATLFGDPAPMFAVFGALNGMQSTVTASLRRTVGALVGIMLGTLLAVLSEAVQGAPKPLVVALLVGLGLLLTIRLNAYSLLGTEVVVSGLLVFALSHGNALWSLGRFGETALGGGIAVALNVLVLPPDYRQDARRSVSTLAAVLKQHLRTALEDVLAPPSKADARAHLLAVRAAVHEADALVEQTARAREALRLSPLVRYGPFRHGSPAEVERYVTGVQALASALVHARTASRAAWHASRRSTILPASADWAALLTDLESTVDRFERYLLEGSPATREVAGVALRYTLREHAAVMAASQAADEPWDLDRAAALAEVEHVVDDLQRALKDERSGD